MKHVCPSCKQNRLAVVCEMGIPLSQESIGETLQLLLCDRCGQHLLGLDCQAGDGPPGLGVEDAGYPIGRELWADLHLSWATCPNPPDRSCRCQGHQELARLLAQVGAISAVAAADPSSAARWGW